MNDMNIYTIVALKYMFYRMGFPSYQFKASAEFMNMDWKLYSGKRHLPQNATEKRKIGISQDMERYG